jgi:peptide/nickel transport system permease protein
MRIVERWPVTAQIASLALIAILCLGVPLGIVAAVARFRPLDQILGVAALVGGSVPSLIIAIVLILVTPYAGFVPFTEDPLGSLASSILPALALTLTQIGSVARLTRSSMREVFREDYIIAARAFGVAPFELIGRDALSNAVRPVLSRLGTITGFVLGGSIVVESVFGIAGLGRLLVESFATRHFEVTIAVALLFTSVVVAVKVVANLLNGNHLARVPGRAARQLMHHRAPLLGLAGVGALLLLIAVVGPSVAPYDPTALSASRLRPPSLEHWMGTEDFGRDVLSRFLHGARVSMFVALGAVSVALLMGTSLGVIASLRAGSAWDTVIMRALDIVRAFPVLVLVSVVAGGLQLGALGLDSVTVVGLAIGVVSMPAFARIARSSALAESGADYVLAARSFGARTQDVLFGNLLPNFAPPLLVQAAFSLAVAIAVQAAVSFLGLGIHPAEVSWGNMLADARRFVLLGAWWPVAFPAAAIVVAGLSFNLLGATLRDALEPR